MSVVRTKHNVAALDDDALLAEITTGNRDALGELYDRYGERAHRLAHAVCRRDTQADAIVLEAFRMVWRDRGRDQPRGGSVAAWLLRSVRDQAIDHMDRTAQPGPETTQHPDPLSLLPDVQQEVIALALYGRLSSRDIAAELGLSPDTIKVRMRLGLHQLRAGAELNAPVAEPDLDAR